MQRLCWTFALWMATACGTGVDLGGTAIDAGQSTDAVAGTCPSFVPPGTTAACEGCPKGSTTCARQSNGCFNGYFCDVEDSGFTDCKAPGTPCSTSGKIDAH